MEHKSDPRQSPTPDSIEAELSGQQLYGEQLAREQIQRWNEQTDAVHRALFAACAGGSAEAQGGYQYGALDHFHAIGALLRRRYGCCLALGCAAGDDVAPLAGVVERFIAIEPIEQCWRSEIGGKSARYLKPTVLGDLELEDASVDLAVAIDVLHHVANVSHVLGELARVLHPGGLLVVRDPISWMGDWRRPRPGLTANERGLPLPWFEQTTQAKGFRIVRRRLCMFTPLSMLMRRCGIARPLSHRPIILLDWLASELLRWNVHYRRESLLAKLGPSSALWLLEKKPY